jgi:hypothetical protein
VLGFFLAAPFGPSRGAEDGDYALIRLAGRGGKPVVCIDDNLDIATFMTIRGHGRLSHALAGVDTSALSLGPDRATASRALKQTGYCTMVFGPERLVREIVRDLGQDSTATEPEILSRSEFAALAHEATVAREKAALLPLAVQRCEAEIFAHIPGPKYDGLSEVRFLGTDGATFGTDRRFEQVAGSRLVLYPSLWSHDLATVTIVYVIPPADPAARKTLTIECAVDSLVRPTGVPRVR